MDLDVIYLSQPLDCVFHISFLTCDNYIVHIDAPHTETLFLGLEEYTRVNIVLVEAKINNFLFKFPVSLPSDLNQPIERIFQFQDSIFFSFWFLGRLKFVRDSSYRCLCLNPHT
jgi:hypothetical protein